jgi:hypothetical protein
MSVINTLAYLDSEKFRGTFRLPHSQILDQPEKNLLVTNALAYFAPPPATKKSWFITLPTGETMQDYEAGKGGYGQGPIL